MSPHPHHSLSIVYNKHRDREGGGWEREEETDKLIDREKQGDRDRQRHTCIQRELYTYVYIQLALSHHSVIP